MTEMQMPSGRVGGAERHALTDHLTTPGRLA